jgi:hypothetical protein
MLEQPNVLTLLVSATPFNVLGQPSYIKEENVISWFRPGEKGGAYMRLEDYLLTIPSTNEDASTNTARPSIRSDQLFDKNFPEGDLKKIKPADRDYILMADYIFSFCLYSALLWDKENGVLKEAKDYNVSDAQRDAFMEEYQRLTGVHAENCELLKEGWDLASIKKLHRVGKKLFWTRLGSPGDRIGSEIDPSHVKQELEKIMMRKIVDKQPPLSDTDLIVEDLLRSSSGELMHDSTKRVLCGRMTIIRWEPVRTTMALWQPAHSTF